MAKQIWRLLEHDKINDSFMKMAIDESILIHVGEKKSLPTLRFYSWNKPAVAIGYFQKINEVIYVDKCIEDGVEIFRRVTGGGAVYKDPLGEINYSVVLNEELVPLEIQPSFCKICEPIMNGLKKLGMQTEFSGTNDIMLNGKKISGNAQTRQNGAILQHGTILYDFHPEIMAKYLIPPKDKLLAKGLEDIKQRVGTIKQFSPNTTLFEVEKNIILGFEEYFDVELILGELSLSEKKMAEELYKKYKSDDWISWQ
ncbi:MAG: biotin/lipoate A/B protein ligase family protein [Candidatus Woesearchaeota archaeon]|jgi:lipoate-protein ligase A